MHRSSTSYKRVVPRWELRCLELSTQSTDVNTVNTPLIFNGHSITRTTSAVYGFTRMLAPTEYAKIVNRSRCATQFACGGKSDAFHRQS